MSKIKNIKNVYIEFNILLDSKIDAIKEEIDILIGAGKYVFVWSKIVPINDMIIWCIENDLFDHIWDYKIKDSTSYAGVDMIIDNDQHIVDRFSRRGIPANFVKKIE